MDKIKFTVEESLIPIVDDINEIISRKEVVINKNIKPKQYIKGDLDKEFTSTFYIKIDAPTIGEDIKNTRTMDMIFVLDVSGSMDENNKLVDLKRISKDIIGKLDSNTNLGIIAFSDSVYKQMELTRLDASGKQKAIAFIQNLSAQSTTYLLSSMNLAKNWLAKSTSENKCLIIQTDGEIFDNGKTAEFAAIKDYCISNQIIIQSIALGNGINRKDFEFMQNYLCTRGSVVNAGKSKSADLEEALSKVFNKMNSLAIKKCYLCFDFFDKTSTYKQRVIKVISSKNNKLIDGSEVKDNKVDLGSFVSGQNAEVVVELMHRPQSKAIFENAEKDRGLSFLPVCLTYLEYQDVTGEWQKTEPQLAKKKVLSANSVAANLTDVGSSDSDIDAAKTIAIMIRKDKKDIMYDAGKRQNERESAEGDFKLANDFIMKVGNVEEREKAKLISQVQGDKGILDEATDGTDSDI